MTDRPQLLIQASRHGAIVRQVPIRIVEISSTGCLLESSHVLPIGIVGELRLLIDSQEYTDTVRICRATRVAGSGVRYRIGAEFLRLMPSSPASLRDLARRIAGLE